MLCLGPWRLKGTGENGEAGIFDGVRHLRMGHVLVDEDTLDEFRVAEGAADFPIDLDEVKENILAFKIGNLKDRVNSDLSKLLVLLGDTVAICRVSDSRNENVKVYTFCCQDWSWRF